MDRSLPHRDAAGFSLLELACVLGLLAVLLAVALPQVSAALPGRLLDRAARELAADLRLARVDAVRETRRVRVRVEIGEATVQIESDQEGSFVAVGAPRPLPPGVFVDATRSSRVSGDSVAITFQPRGHTADNATIALTAPGAVARRVIVSRAGRVRVE